jgi:octaprenyl-diphosphate synthase
MNISSIKKGPIEEEMKRFEPYFRDHFNSGIPLLNTVTHYLLRRKGKQMRPSLVFLSAKLNGGVTERTYTAAGLIELLHTATLVHDDVVDETYQRRGFFSINALWRSKIAVLVGDYFLAIGLIKSLESNQTGVLKIVSEAVKEMSEGELLQLEKSRKLNITESDYYEIIRKKTATLIASCTMAGAYSADADEATMAKMKDFGTNLGMAFQIRDDLLDYERSNILGKPTGNDLKEKKLTLPLIYVLSNVSLKEKRRILSTIKRHHKNEKKLVPIINLVKSKGGLEYTREKMKEYGQKALEILSTFDDSPSKEALKQMVAFAVERKK